MNKHSIYFGGDDLLTRDEQKEKRRMDILAAGLDLFVRNGYQATKVSDIAKKLNMSVGLLFHYFESKEKLYEELVTMGLAGTKMPMQMKFDSPIMFFEGFVNQLFANVKKHPMIAQIFILMAEAGRNETTPPAVRKIALQVDAIEQSVEIIKQGQRLGEIRQGNPLALSNAFWCSVQGIIEQLATNSEQPFPEVEWIIDIIRERNIK